MSLVSKYVFSFEVLVNDNSNEAVKRIQTLVTLVRAYKTTKIYIEILENHT